MAWLAALSGHWTAAGDPEVPGLPDVDGLPDVEGLPDVDGLPDAEADPDADGEPLLEAAGEPLPDGLVVADVLGEPDADVVPPGDALLPDGPHAARTMLALATSASGNRSLRVTSDLLFPHGWWVSAVSNSSPAGLFLPQSGWAPYGWAGKCFGEVSGLPAADTL